MKYEKIIESLTPGDVFFFIGKKSDIWNDNFVSLIVAEKILVNEVSGTEFFEDYDNQEISLHKSAKEFMKEMGNINSYVSSFHKNTILKKIGKIDLQKPKLEQLKELTPEYFL